MDVDGLQKLIKLMNENDLCELEVEEGEKKVRLRKHDRHPPAASQMMVPMPMAAMSAPAPAAAPAPEAGKPAARAPRTDVVEVRSPLVGTFFRAPKPGAPPFVDLGARVSAEKTLCIIEAMKVMNEIKAEVEGVVEEILVNNGEPVEFNQVLFLIRKS